MDQSLIWEKNMEKNRKAEIRTEVKGCYEDTENISEGRQDGSVSTLPPSLTT